MREQYAALPLLLDPVLSTPAALQPGAFPCPKCGKALRRREGKTPANFSGAAPMPIAGRFCRMRTVNPVSPKKSLREW